MKTLILACAILAATPLQAQWIKQPAVGIPRLDLLEYVCAETPTAQFGLKGRTAEEKTVKVPVDRLQR